MLGEIDELFIRPKKWKIFVSSRMRDNVLDLARQTAVQAIESSQLAEAWYWERDACAGPYSADNLCVCHARTSDGLVLVLAEDLSPITRKEYLAAYHAGVPCYIMLKDGVTRDKQTQRFIDRERKHSVTVNFGNLSELSTQITNAIYQFAILAGREKILNTRQRRSGLRQPKAVTQARPMAKGGYSRDVSS